MRCRLSVHGEVTQCYLCLRYGHLAVKCHEQTKICAHYGRKGHISEDCAAADADPSCSNCGVKHNARDKSYSARTNYLLSVVSRTDYGVSK